MPKNAELFSCEVCKFECSKKSNYEKHLLTAKHKNRTILNKKSQGLFCEICNKSFNARNSLWYHKKKCKKIEEQKEAVKLKNDEEDDKKDKIIELLMEQNEKLMEMAQKPNIINNTINQNFNLNVFLNEKCKDAMSLEDFVNSIELTLEDYKNTGENGFVKGISDIVVNKIKDLDTYERPLHCTDLKRQTIYIKNEDKWEKDDSKENLRKAVKRVAKKNEDMAPMMIENLEIKDEKAYEKVLNYYINAINTDNEEEKQQEDKIIKNVLKEVIVDK